MTNNRQVNHIQHHKASPPRTLMRRSVNPPVVSNSLKVKTHYSFRYHQTTALGPQRRRVANPSRLERASKISKSDYVDHFIKPLGSSFTPSHTQPIKAVVHKPEVKSDLSIDALLMKAVDSVEDQLVNLEQQPIRRLHRFSRSLVANRFNGVALD